MSLAPVAVTPAAVRDALQRRGMDAVRADAAARGTSPVAVVLDDVDPATRDRVAVAAHEHGLACLTGAGWVFLAGTAAQLAALIRPGFSVLAEEPASALGRHLEAVASPPQLWETARGTIVLERPVVVGILNVTPDSFSDGGTFLEPEAALRHAEAQVAAGADMLDVGGESTRPGRPDPVPADEEWRRLVGVLPELVRRFPTLPISVDTVKAATARRALDAGAWVINDVTGLRHDAEVASAAAAQRAGLVLMHSRGPLAGIASYEFAEYTEIAVDVLRELSVAAGLAEAAGVPSDCIVVDPGLGFGKRPEMNYAVLHRLSVFGALGYPVMVGPSRKRFLGAVTGKEVGQRDGATAAACVAAFHAGAQVFRVHAVAEVKEALTIAHTIRTA